MLIGTESEPLHTLLSCVVVKKHELPPSSPEAPILLFAQAAHDRSHLSCDLLEPQSSLWPATQNHPLPMERSRRKNLVKMREGIGLGGGGHPAAYQEA